MSLNKPASTVGDNLQNSVEWLKQTVSKIRELNISAEPKNYTLWYTYFSGANASLNKEMDRKLKQSGQFDNQVAEELYRRYILNACEKQQAEMRNAIRVLLKKISSELAAYGMEVGQFEESLSECEAQLKIEDPDVKTLDDVVTTLIVETKKCRTKNSDAMAMVEAANAQIEAMNQELKQLSAEVMQDALTGIANRRAFDQALRGMLSELDSDSKLCLLMLDIDHFKLINDQHGHIVGDRVLRFVAEMIKQSVKGQDFVARFGGEEFVVILPETDYKGGICIANAILQKIATRKLTVDKSGTPLGRVTLSGGLSQAKPGDEIEDLIERADKLLYKAKAMGRNTIKTDTL